ncbi:MAG: hypothetical protein J3K34DRAFT_412678 [Monoraphidium minutum]|nr:MAG: hypothetical protein J3K34DRAFT_412678 [Monoraphidium minutum]
MPGTLMRARWVRRSAAQACVTATQLGAARRCAQLRAGARVRAQHALHACDRRRGAAGRAQDAHRDRIMRPARPPALICPRLDARTPALAGHGCPPGLHAAKVCSHHILHVHFSIFDAAPVPAVANAAACCAGPRCPAWFLGWQRLAGYALAGALRNALRHAVGRWSGLRFQGWLRASLVFVTLIA